MERRELGNTGLNVSILGFGAGGIGQESFSDFEAGRLLHSVLDMGINLMDTARSYGLSEERIGRHLKTRRNEYVLSTKIGYGIPGYEDWTGPVIVAGVEHALRVMQTDWIDIVHLHSCPLETLMRDDILQALQKVVETGKARAAGYSGDNDAFDWGVNSGVFPVLQTSVNVCDQRAIRSLTVVERKGIGIIAKRSLANIPWRATPSTGDNAALEYQRRWKLLGFEFGAETALRFVAYLPGVDCCLTGSSNIDHILHNVEWVKKGPLPADIHQHILSTFSAHGADWPGQI